MAMAGLYRRVLPSPAIDFASSEGKSNKVASSEGSLHVASKEGLKATSSSSGLLPTPSQFGEAQAKELKANRAQLAKAKAEPDINPNLIEVSERVITKEKPKELIPEIEW